MNLPIKSVVTLPIASSRLIGKIFRLAINSADDSYWICARKADGSFEWKELAFV